MADGRQSKNEAIPDRKEYFFSRYQRSLGQEYPSSSSIARLSCQMISNQPSPWSNPQHMQVCVIGES
jgi:hypothetical protein